MDCGEKVGGGGGATNPDEEVRYDASDTLVPGTCEITTLVIR